MLRFSPLSLVSQHLHIFEISVIPITGLTIYLSLSSPVCPLLNFYQGTSDFFITCLDFVDQNNLLKISGWLLTMEFRGIPPFPFMEVRLKGCIWLLDASVTEKRMQGLQLISSAAAVVRCTCGPVTLISMNCFILVGIDPSASGHLILGCDFIMFPSSHFSLALQPVRKEQVTLETRCLENVWNHYLWFSY